MYGSVSIMSKIASESRVDMISMDFSPSLFGAGLALSSDGGLLVAGAPGPSTDSRGSIAIYIRPATGWIVKNAKGENVQTEPTIYFNGKKPGMRMGMRTGISQAGQTVVFSTPGEDGFGKVHYFLAPAGGWNAYKKGDSLISGFLGAAPEFGSEFGKGLAISTDDSTIAIGAPGSMGRKGVVYLFKKPAGGWMRTETLFPITPLAGTAHEPGSRFGDSVAVSRDGRVIAVGAPGPDGATGSIYVITNLDFKPGTKEIQPVVRLLKMHPQAVNAGISIAVSGDGRTIATGTYGQADNGSVLVYKSRSGNWNDGGDALLYTYPVSKTETKTTGAMFGFSVCLTDDGSFLLVGSPMFDKGNGRVEWIDLNKK